MSVRVMTKIFESEFKDLPLPPKQCLTKVRLAKASSLKLVMLAIADCANDEGQSSYPGLTSLARKTALSRRGLIDVLSALRFKGMLVVSDQPSHLGTNNYSIIFSAFSSSDEVTSPELVKPLHPPSEVTSPKLVKPLHPIHPLTINTFNPPSTAKPKFVNLSPHQALAIPELIVYREATGRTPAPGQYETIWGVIRKMNGQGNSEFLRPFWLEWNARGYNSSSLAWLTDWATAGEIPVQKQPVETKYPPRRAAARSKVQSPKQLPTHELEALRARAQKEVEQ